MNAATPSAARAKIDPKTAIGAVHLTVRDLDRVTAFYQESLGFTLLRREPLAAFLGAGDRELLALWASPDAPRPRHATGLYHFAILVPSRAELGRSLRRLRRSRTHLGGASDHGVSEALYLSDPEGNGIEIYRDRPPAEWPRSGEEVAMTSDPIDLESLTAEPGAGPEDRPLLPGTVIGHVHLRVADVGQAESFYADVLGFDRVARYGDSASFLSAGGYHHHVGLNTWESRGAPPPPRGAAGLRHFVLRLPDEAAREAVLDRVRRTGFEVELADDRLLLSDPSANRIALEIPPRA